MPVPMVLGLGAAALWGGADFLAGFQSRRLPAPSVLLWSQVTGSVLLLAGLALVSPDVALTGTSWGAAAGVLAGLALLLFYRAMAIGPMSIVAPVSATGAVVPVGVDLARGDVPGPAVLAGIALAIVGVVLVSAFASGDVDLGPTAEDGRRALALAVLSALGFGSFLVLVDEAFAREGASQLWVVSAARGASIATVLSVVATGRAPAPWPGARIRVIGAIGLMDTTATLFIAEALARGALGIVAVLGGQYPVVTVLLARLVLAERLTRGQGVGVVSALAGVGLLATG